MFANGDTSQPEHGVATPALTGLTDQGWTIESLVVAFRHSCALAKLEGLVDVPTPFCWGSGDFGRLGNGGTADSATAVAVDSSTGLSSVSALHLGSRATFAIDANDDLWVWGDQDVSGDHSGGSFKPSPLIGLDQPCDPALCAP